MRIRALEVIHLSLYDVRKCDDKGVKSILSTQLWIQTYVFIVNRSMTYRVAIATNGFKFITYDILLIFPQLFCNYKRQILYTLCECDALHELIKIHDHFEWSHDDIQSNDNRAFTLACWNGQLDTSKWLSTVFNLIFANPFRQSWKIKTLRGARIYRRHDVVEWLYTFFQFTVDDV